MHVSTVGTGAGRATGGPCFNFVADHVSSKIVDEDVEKKDLAEYADDGEILLPAEPRIVKRVLNCFEGAVDVGLTVHPHPTPKGPQFLLDACDPIMVNPIPQEEDLSDLVNVVDRMVFLGLEQTIQDEKSVFHIKPSIFSKMYFYARELIRGLKIICFDADEIDWHAWVSISQAIASFIENRIQYFIIFVDLNAIAKLYALHRYVIAGILGFKPSFFGFKPIKLTKPTRPDNLYTTLDKLISPTYLLLCKISGRPNLFDLAHRATVVSLEQYVPDPTRTRRQRDPEFIRRLKLYVKNCKSYKVLTVGKTSKNDFHKRLLEISNKFQRRVFIKLMTDRFFLQDLDSHGFDVPSHECRLCPGSGTIETAAHFFSEHANFAQSSTKLVKMSGMIQKRLLSEAMFSASTPQRKRSKKAAVD